ncbi:MAG: rod shape-determining protein MreC [Oscillospiraceae bacterium]|nr:rod shape-determining protein MreC [Oscillospiraceae bacterium]
MKRPKHFFEIIIISLIVICVFVIGYTYNRTAASSIESKIEFVLSKVQGVFYGIGNGIRSSIDNVKNFSKIKSENEALKKEIYDLTKENEELKANASDIEQFRIAFDIAKTDDLYTRKGCNVIGMNNPGGYTDKITIDRGTNGEIKNGMVIVDYLNELVGKVVTSREDNAIVQLLTNSDIRVSASVNTPDNVYGTAYGYSDNLNRAMCKFEISINADVKIGDTVVTTGVGNIYPKGISIGEITSVEEDKVKLLKVCNVKPFVDISKLKLVYVIIPSNKLNVVY